MNLKELSQEELKIKIINKEVTIADIVDAGICPTCFDKENNHVLYGDNTDKMIYEDEDFEVFLVGNPRANGHTAISTKVHYKDMMEIPDDLCTKIFILAKKTMNIIKEVYKTESVYLCTMCDGPMNHFHVQLIPRYDFEKRGSKNFVKPRFDYVEDKDKIKVLREKLEYKED
jgi:histidine triad (HIT) family protein